MKKKPNHTYILREVFRRIAKSDLAVELKTSRQYVSAWKKVPLSRAKEVSAITKIPLKILRPDIYD